MKHFVTSADGKTFVVESDERTVAYDQAYAKSQHSRVLSGNPDFVEVQPLSELLPAAPEFVFEAPRISGPLEKRAAFRVIRGGKP